MTIKQKINLYKCRKGTKPDRKVTMKILNESYVREMVEVELYLMGCEVQKIVEEIDFNRRVLDALLEGYGVKETYYNALYKAG